MHSKSHHQVLRDLRVQDAMRKLVIRLPATALLSEACRAMIKYKVNAVLVVEARQTAVGVVSKTDLMTAYAASLPLGMEVSQIMVGPPRYCHPEDSLDTALDQMREFGIHRLYVTLGRDEPVCGVLAYPDIVGMLYRLCHRCDKSLLHRGHPREVFFRSEQLLVREVMTPNIFALPPETSLWAVMGGLAAYKFGAVPIVAADGQPVGVVSKTDLITAYLHALSPDVPARTIMSSPVLTCRPDELLLDVIQRLIFWDLHRIFVFHDRPESLVGVLSLSDAARFRSGSCRACLASRISP
ncbi:MAG: CBS domain-containing protein [Desulfobacca sp.]|uniref:CBS domain-containing protein n=1 Tax=Desulfobacca sp. TaxID=2067990 RepID=UPI00404B039B